ncbi:MAG: response regulator [Deltaproteobacteria bacterium]|nr:response regulator [Deltaproteobacteria bacterium]
MEHKESFVYIVDDDQSILKALMRLLRSIGLEVRAYKSAKDFLSNNQKSARGCLVLDVQMSDMTGIELHEHLVECGYCLPTIFISAHDNVPIRDYVKRSGILSFIQKPFDDQVLIKAIRRALS